MKKKYIIGLGCSWTQGHGGYPEHVWEEHDGRIQISGRSDYYLRHYEHENSWVNVLCRDHFPEYTPVNLGVRGIGNRAAVNQLHFCDTIDFNNSTGIIVLMLSGFERLDFFKESPVRQTDEPDGYSFNDYAHYKWRTIWPLAGRGGEYEPLWNFYAKVLWSEQFSASNQMMALLDAQTFAKAYGYKLVVANAFNRPPGGVKQYLKDNAGRRSEKFDWNTYIHEATPYSAFIQKLVELDGLMDPKDWTKYHPFYHKREWHSTYLTNCEGAHPTIEGYKIIGDELAHFIKNNDYI